MTVTIDPPAGIEPKLLKRFVQLEKRRRELESQLKEAKAESGHLEAMLLEKFAESGIASIKVDGLTVYLHRQLWAGPIDGNYIAACEALQAVGLGDMVEPRFNTNTLSAWVRERDKEGEALPPTLSEAIKVTEQFSIRTRKGS